MEGIIDEVTNVKSECNFADKEKAVCAPSAIVDHMHAYVKDKGIVIEYKTPVYIVNKMKDLLNCKSESCIIKHPNFIEFAKLSNIEDVLNKFFRPDGPATHFGLLSNFNIDDVLDQLVKRFPERKFLHIPYQMRDFEKVGTRLATVDLAEEFKTHDTFGCVLNTDYSTGRGIHWFCIFGEKYRDKIVLEYFNSSGKEPLPEIQAYLHKNKHYLEKSMKLPVEIKYNTGVQYQRDEHSCGVYSVMYIYSRLSGVAFQEIKTEQFNDDLMHKARLFMFRVGV